MDILTTFKTWPKHQQQFYKVTTSAISFWVRAPLTATVGLTDTPEVYCVYNIEIEQNKCSLKADCAPLSTVTTPHVLSREEFRKFWITWHNGRINFGEGQRTIISYKCSVENIRYVTFHVTSGVRCVEWRCHLPPLIESLPVKEIQGGELKWVEIDEDDEELPEGALIGGHEGEFLYIMRTFRSTTVVPGKYVPSVGNGYIAWDSYSFECTPTEILCGFNCTWVAVNGNKLPLGAVEGGYTEDREILYIGRVHHEGHLIVGRVQASTKLCYFAFANMQQEARFFDVLVQPCNNVVDVVSVAAPEYCEEDDFD